MASRTVQAIVLRRADLRENDRMLTLLTPRGREEALCRGCKRPSSPLLSASECFVMGEYVLYTGKGISTVTSCQITESFYPLRENWDRLRAASCMLSLCETAAQPAQDTKDLFTLLARSLFRLAYKQEMGTDTVMAGFLLHFAVLNGYRPQLSVCARCGQPAEHARLFDTEDGGVLCEACARFPVSAFPLHEGQLEWMTGVMKAGIERYPDAEKDPPADLLIRYLSAKMEKKIIY